MNSSLFVTDAGVLELLKSSSSMEDTSHRSSFSILVGGSRLLGVAKGALWWRCVAGVVAATVWLLRVSSLGVRLGGGGGGDLKVSPSLVSGGSTDFVDLMECCELPVALMMRVLTEKHGAVCSEEACYY